MKYSASLTSKSEFCHSLLPTTILYLALNLMLTLYTKLNINSGLHFCKQDTVRGLASDQLKFFPRYSLKLKTAPPLYSQ